MDRFTRVIDNATTLQTAITNMDLAGESYEISVTLDASMGRGRRRAGSGGEFIVGVDSVVDGVPSGKPHQIGSWLKGTRCDIVELQSASSKSAAGQPKSAESK